MRIYPKLKINLTKFRENYRIVDRLCKDNGIENVFVIKGCNGLEKIVETAVEEGAEIIATSRYEQFENLGEDWDGAEKMLLRVSTPSETEDVIRWSDISLESDMKVLGMLDREAEKQGKTHQVILMEDLGDLREGFMYREDIIKAAETVENSMDNLILAGIGTNLGCYGSVLPTKEKMESLIETGKIIEKKISRKLRFISGGGTTVLPLLVNHTMPSGINMLRIGETILMGRDLAENFDCTIEGIHDDVFTLEGQLAEVSRKPSYPVGQLICDCFGFHPEYEDRGIILHGLLGMGKVDYGYTEMLIPYDRGVRVLGASSDHTLVDLTEMEKKPETGDILRFKLAYANMVHLSGRKDVNIEFEGR